MIAYGDLDVIEDVIGEVRIRLRDILLAGMKAKACHCLHAAALSFSPQNVHINSMLEYINVTRRLTLFTGTLFAITFTTSLSFSFSTFLFLFWGMVAGAGSLPLFELEALSRLGVPILPLRRSGGPGPS